MAPPLCQISRLYALGSTSQLDTTYLQELTIPYEMGSRDFDHSTFDTVLGELLGRIRRRKVLELDKCSQREILSPIGLIGKSCKYLCNCASTRTDPNV